MRIREIILNNVRSFRGEHRISFVNPLTEAANPITVIAGTNGTGKTTILEMLETLLTPRQPSSLLGEVYEGNGFACLNIELNHSELIGEKHYDSDSTLWIGVGNLDFAPPKIKESFPRLDPMDAMGRFNIPSGLSVSDPLLFKDWQSARDRMSEGKASMCGGLIYFPQTRHPFLSTIAPKGIQPPPPVREWVSRVSASDQWDTSLEGFFVWQNYLDLEANAHRIPPNRLKNFVSEIESVLGKDRHISIKEGRVYVPTTWSAKGAEPTLVRLDQLPSGEQQTLWMLGELARRRRDSAVILIDEPETSLHPTLQRGLVHQLRTMARNWDCQLILATHSLEILRSVHQSSRINLDHLEPQEEAAEVSYAEAA